MCPRSCTYSGTCGTELKPPQDPNRSTRSPPLVIIIILFRQTRHSRRKLLFLKDYIFLHIIYLIFRGGCYTYVRALRTKPSAPRAFGFSTMLWGTRHRRCRRRLARSRARLITVPVIYFPYANIYNIYVETETYLYLVKRRHRID